MKESNDILTLFESLSSHEVFTPPRIAKDLLGLIPKDVWNDPNTTVLDPCAKSGVFLREAMYLLVEGLRGKGLHQASDGETYDLNAPKQLMKHILKNMLFGIATSEVTGYFSRRTLYGVMEASTDKQTALIDALQNSKSNLEWSEDKKIDSILRNNFNEYYDHNIFNTSDDNGYEHEGNIFYPRDEVQKKVVEEGSYETEETYYPFIEEHTKHAKIQSIRSGEMKFDVIIGNPPYQVNDGGNSKSAKPIYHLFVNQAKEMSPKYLAIIIPSRWFSGGKGLNKFRDEMLNDRRISHIVDFENSSEVFPGVDVAGGINYFLWDKNHNGDCEFTNSAKGSSFSSTRPLNDFHILIRHSNSLPIIHKIKSTEKGPYLDSVVSARKPFGIQGNHNPQSKGIPCWFSQKIGRQFVQSDVIRDELKYKDKWKVLIPYAPIAGQTDFSKPVKFYHSMNVKIAEPGEVCTETYLVAHAFTTEIEAMNFKSYLFTKLFRFLLLQNVISQHVARGCFCFVPELDDYTKEVTDDILRKKWNITQDEWDFVCTRIQETG